MPFHRLALAVLGSFTLAVAGAASVLAQWPTSCVEANDAFEQYVGNHHNVSIYQKTFGDAIAAEQACRNDHRDDVRGAFAWALEADESVPVTSAPAAAEPWIYEEDANDATAYAWTDVESIGGRASLYISCYKDLSPRAIGVSIAWGTPTPITGFPTERASIDVVYWFHGEQQATRGFWTGQQVEGFVLVLLPQEGDPIGFARRTLTAPALAVLLVESGTEADFSFQHRRNDSNHPVQKVLRACGY